MSRTDGAALFDFSRATTTPNWQIVNDTVMGGVSSAELDLSDGTLRFRGTLSLAEGGGFVSCRAPLPRRLGPESRLRIAAMGDGRRWQLRLRLGDEFDGVAWRAPFTTRAGVWLTYDFGRADFEPVYRGHVLTDFGALDLTHVGQLGFLLAERQAGPFTLLLARIDELRA